MDDIVFITFFFLQNTQFKGEKTRIDVKFKNHLMKLEDVHFERFGFHLSGLHCGVPLLGESLSGSGFNLGIH